MMLDLAARCTHDSALGVPNKEDSPRAMAKLAKSESECVNVVASRCRGALYVTTPRDRMLQPRPELMQPIHKAVENSPCAWILLYLDGKDRAEIVTAGERMTVIGTGFSGLLSIIDSTELLCRPE